MDRTQRIAPAIGRNGLSAGRDGSRAARRRGARSSATTPPTPCRRATGRSACRAAALERHIAYDIGAAALTRALARRLDAPAVLSTFSRLLIDPNRGADDPTLVMRYSDGAIVPGNARADAAEIALPRARYWAPYRETVAATIEAMLPTGEPPALVAIHSFTPIWRGTPRCLENRGVVGPRRPHCRPAARGARRRGRPARDRNRRQRAL